MAATTPGTKAVLTGLVRVATPPYEFAGKYIRWIGRSCQTVFTHRPVAVAIRLPSQRRSRPRALGDAAILSPHPTLQVADHSVDLGQHLELHYRFAFDNCPFSGATAPG